MRMTTVSFWWMHRMCMNDPLALCKRNRKNIHIASDVCDIGAVKKWLRKVHIHSDYPKKEAFIRNKNTLLNCGIVVGMKKAILPFFKQVNDDILNYYSRRHNSSFPIDMLVINAVAPRFNITTGYPHDYVNTPMWNNYCCQIVKDHNPCKGNCTNACIHDAILSDRKRYYFAHKS